MVAQKTEKKKAVRLLNISERLKVVTKPQMKSKFSEFGPGDQVKVWYKILEKDRTRLAPFEGVVIRRKGSGLSETFTVRRMTYGEGVERVFPVHAPMLDRVEVIRRGKVRRANLYYLRSKVGKTRIDAAVQTSQASSTVAQEAPVENSQEPSAQEQAPS